MVDYKLSRLVIVKLPQFVDKSRTSKMKAKLLAHFLKHSVACETYA